VGWYLSQVFFPFLLGQGWSLHDIEDATQVALLYVWERYDQLDETVSDNPLRTWVTTMINRRLVDIWRSRRREAGEVLLSELTLERLVRLLGEEKTALPERPIIQAIETTVRKYLYDYRHAVRAATEVLSCLLRVYLPAHEGGEWHHGFPMMALEDALELSRAAIHRRLKKRFRNQAVESDILDLVREEYDKLIELQT
jgi:DNA-directed RNA polymerase specialized sigma24 family protein